MAKVVALSRLMTMTRRAVREYRPVSEVVEVFVKRTKKDSVAACSQPAKSAPNHNPKNASTALVVHNDERHPLAAICPEMNPRDLAALTEDIAAQGLVHAIVRHEGKILDGWARYKACRACGVEPAFHDFDPGQEGDPRQFVLRMLFRRKHLVETQRAMIAALLVTSSVGFNQTNEGTTIEAAATMASVSGKSVERARAVHRRSTIVAEAVANGRIPSMRCATTLSELPEDVQRSVLAGDSSGPALKKKINTASREWKKAQPIVLPQGRFEVIVADPPWPVDKTPYVTMSVSEIEADLQRHLEEKAADDCNFFLWTTQAHLRDALSITQRLGWTDKFVMSWRKNNGPQNPLGPMYTEEFVVVASRGSPSFIDTKDFKTGFYGRKRAHSEKPDEFYRTIARVTRGPRLELYTRKRHEGFEAHGNEIIDSIAIAPVMPMETDERPITLAVLKQGPTFKEIRIKRVWRLEGPIPVKVPFQRAAG